MNNSKHWLKSKTLWGLFILTIAAISKQPIPQTKADWFRLIWIGFGAFFAAYGRIVAVDLLGIKERPQEEPPLGV